MALHHPKAGTLQGHLQPWKWAFLSPEGLDVSQREECEPSFPGQEQLGWPAPGILTQLP